MDINVQKYLDMAANDEVQHFEQSVSPEMVPDATGMTLALQPVVEAVVQALSKNQLIRATLTVMTTVPTTISFETGIINMPLVNAKKAGNFFEIEEIVPVKVYLVTESPFLNASGLRIDEIATSDVFAGATDKLLANIAPHVVEQLQHVAEEEAKPAPEPAKPAAKKTTRKTTAKKTTAKKSTTKKATAKKATAKKPAAKKTTTKKAPAKKTTRTKKVAD